MAGFLYYRPGVTKTVTLADVRAWGLGYAFTSNPSGTVCMSHTPDGGNGVVFGDKSRLGDWQPLMEMPEQEWVKSCDHDWYVGYWKAAPPTAEDLARAEQLRGYPVTIAGQTWLIPQTAAFDEESRKLLPALPARLKYAGQGHWKKGEVLELYRELWSIGEPFREDFLGRYVRGESPRNFSDDEIFEALMAHLHVNYVIGRDELGHMPIPLHRDDPGIGLAIMVANHLPTIMAWSEQQKKTADLATAQDSGTSAGEPG